MATPVPITVADVIMTLSQYIFSDNFWLERELLSIDSTSFSVQEANNSALALSYGGEVSNVPPCLPMAWINLSKSFSLGGGSVIISHISHLYYLMCNIITIRTSIFCDPGQNIA